MAVCLRGVKYRERLLQVMMHVGGTRYWVLCDWQMVSGIGGFAARSVISDIKYRHRLFALNTEAELDRLSCYAKLFHMICLIVSYRLQCTHRSEVTATVMDDRWVVFLQ
jgi:hypothetical protein